MRFRQPDRSLEFLEGARAVAHRVLLIRLHLTKGVVQSVGNKDRIITKSPVAARRELQMSMHLPFENVRAPIWRGKSKCADEFRGVILRAYCFQFPLHSRHRSREVPVWTSPSR